MEFLFLIVGLPLGFIIAWFIAKNKFSMPVGIDPSEVESKYVLKDLYLDQKKRATEKEEQVVQLSSKLAQVEEQVKNKDEKLNEGKTEIEKIQEQFRLEFKNLSNEIMEEKSKKFIELNHQKVSELLNPLKERIKDFEEKVDETYKEETRERISLKLELKRIVELNQQVSDDATKLTKALKGDKKLQGDWGELQLEMILEKAGLQNGLHYSKQPNYKDEEGRNQRPDYIIHLPEQKNLILDSKVSLVAYEQYFNSEDTDNQERFLNTHVSNLKKHITDLGGKNYQKLYEINSPDYVLMFVPIEPALTVALKNDPQLYEKALEKNIAIVSTSTLLATLRTISHIWKQENQRKNVVEIARQSGALYDKFVGFMEDLVGVGKKLDDAKKTYSESMNKLFESKRKGDTIMGRMENLKTLGAQASKQIPDSLLKKLEE